MISGRAHLKNYAIAFASKYKYLGTDIPDNERDKKDLSGQGRTVVREYKDQPELNYIMGNKPGVGTRASVWLTQRCFAVKGVPRFQL